MTNATHRKGFTLIELLLVVGIIGLIATIAMVAQRNEQAKRRDVKRVADTRSLQQALSLYIAKYNAFPVMTGCVTGTDTVSTALKADGFLNSNSIIADPLNPTNTASCFFYTGTGSQYTLRYTLETNSSAGQAGDHLIVP